MSDPTATGEWTVEQAGSGLAYITASGNRLHEASFNNTTVAKIVAAHNAALAAVCKVSQDSQKAFWECSKQRAAERESVKRIADFAAEVVNAKKDPIAICMNCGVIQHDQLDAICTTCQRGPLRNLDQLREQLAAAVEAIQSLKLYVPRVVFGAALAKIGKR